MWIVDQKIKIVNCRPKKKNVDCRPKNKNVGCRPKGIMWIVDQKI